MIRASFALLLLVLAWPAEARERLRVMSFNVRLPLASDGANDWPQRRDLLVRTIRRAAPDVIGAQELYAEQGAFIVAKLPHYTWFGRGRRGGHGDEHTGVFYRRDRLELIASGDFQLSDAPDVSGSITWGNLYPRMATWGRFRTRQGATFLLVNTHLPYRPEDEAAREKSTRLILDRIAAIGEHEPVVLTGDFNTTADSSVYRLLAATLVDAQAVAPKRYGPEATFHGFTGKPDRRIDWILVRGLGVRRFTTRIDRRGALYPSDHFALVADLEIGTPEEHRGRRSGHQDRPAANRSGG